MCMILTILFHIMCVQNTDYQTYKLYVLLATQERHVPKQDGLRFSNDVNKQNHIVTVGIAIKYIQHTSDVAYLKWNY